jgi:hypothetical protein
MFKSWNPISAVHQPYIQSVRVDNTLPLLHCSAGKPVITPFCLLYDSVSRHNDVDDGMGNDYEADDSENWQGNKKCPQKTRP